MRKLATIRTIANIKPIPNADRIEVAQIDGWEVIISKSDNFSQGDKVVYIEIDSKMPKTPEYDFLKSRKYVVKTIKLRGQVSQGLVLPLAVLPPGDYKVGDDVTEILGVTKYDPEAEQENAIVAENKKRNPIIKYFMRFKWFRKLVIKRTVKDKFPDWIKKTDEERIQNKTGLFEQLKTNKTQLSVTEKVDGTSAPIFDNEFVIPEEWEISDIVHYVQGKSQIYPREREGCVFRNVE